MPLGTRLATPSGYGAENFAIIWSLTSEGGLPGDLAHLSWGSTFCENGFCNTMLTQDFHGPLIDDMCFWKLRCARVSLKKDMPDVMIRKKTREVEPTCCTQV